MSTKSIIASTLIAGLISGSVALAQDAAKKEEGAKVETAGEKHSCKGEKDSCKGKKAKKAHGKKDKNSCKGKEGCGEKKE